MTDACVVCKRKELEAEIERLRQLVDAREADLGRMWGETGAEIARLTAQITEDCTSHNQMVENFSIEIERLWGYVETLKTSQSSAVVNELNDEIARLRTQCGGNCRYWEGRWRDEKADNARLRAALREIAAYPHSEEGGEIARAALRDTKP